MAASWFVAAAWRRLYGFHFDFRVWAAFWLHDIGYLGCRDMDGRDGESHVELGARLGEVLFGSEWCDFYKLCGIRTHCKSFLGQRVPLAPVSNVEAERS